MQGLESTTADTSAEFLNGVGTSTSFYLRMRQQRLLLSMDAAFLVATYTSAVHKPTCICWLLEHIEQLLASVGIHHMEQTTHPITRVTPQRWRTPNAISSSDTGCRRSHRCLFTGFSSLPCTFLKGLLWTIVHLYTKTIVIQYRSNSENQFIYIYICLTWSYFSYLFFLATNSPRQRTS